jgi:hypothetical protein
MDFETYKKQFDENFAKVTPEEFIKTMEAAGVRFKKIKKKLKMKTKKDIKP